MNEGILRVCALELGDSIISSHLYFIYLCEYMFGNVTLLELEYLGQCFVLEVAACCDMSWEQELTIYSFLLFKLCRQTVSKHSFEHILIPGTGQGKGTSIIIKV